MRLALWAPLLLLAACNGKKNVPDAAAAHASGTSTSAETNAPDGTNARSETNAQGYAERVRGNDHLLMSAEHLALLMKRATAGDPAFLALKKNADAYMGDPKNDRTGPENLAVMHLVTGERKYCDAALAFALEGMKEDVRSGSYLYYGDHMREVAVVLDACRKVLADTERRVLADYLDRWTHELWFDNRGSGWGLDDPGNNYFMAFLEGTAFAGYALLGEGHENAKKYLDLLRDKLDNRVFPYLDARGAGGDWHEGVNYGQRSKQRLFSALAVIAAMGGPNHFDRPFVRDALVYAIYQLQPDRMSIYPGGDLARDASMHASPLDRDYILMAVHFMKDRKARGIGKWYLQTIVPSMSDGDFPWRRGLYRDFVYGTEAEAIPPTKLPTSHHAAGTGWINVRTGWGPDATSLSIAGSPKIDQSHAHFDTGSFTIFKGGWQALDASTLSRSGLAWQAGAHNMVTVPGHERRLGDAGGGVLRFEHQPGSHAYAQIDASRLFRTKAGGDAPMIAEYTRELIFLEPDTLVVFDRVAPKNGARPHLRLHLASKPEGGGRHFTARNGKGSLSYAIVIGGESRVAPDADLAEGPSRAFRVETDPVEGRLLTVIATALGAPPPLAPVAVRSADAIAGARIGDDVVVFSSAPRGAPPDAFSYRVDGAARVHTIVNLEPGAGYAVDVEQRDGATTVKAKVAADGSARASERGVLRVTR